MEDEKIKIIHDDKISIFLENMDLKKKLDSGLLKCKFCKKVIKSNKEIYCIFPESNEIKVVCDFSDCILMLINYIDKKGLN